MTSMLSPGVEVIENRNGLTPIQGVSTSIGGFVGLSAQGPVNSPQYITSMPDFVQVFGGPIATSYLFGQVDAFFKNNGRGCWVNRVAYYTDITDPASLTAQKASLDLNTPAGGTNSASLVGSKSAPFSLHDGDSLTLAVDGGAATPFTFAAQPAKVVGVGGTFGGLDGSILSFTIDNDGNNQVVTFDSTCVDAASAVNYFNQNSTKSKAVVQAGQFAIISDKQGTAAAVTVVGGSALSSLGLTAGTTTGTGNVGDISAVTNAEVASILSAAPITYAPAIGPGQPILTSKTTGTSSTLTVTGTAGTALGLSSTQVTGSNAAASTKMGTVFAKSPGDVGNGYVLDVKRVDALVSSLRQDLPPGPQTSVRLNSANQLVPGDFIQIVSDTNSVRVQVKSISGQVVGFDPTTVPSGGVAAAGSKVLRERFSLTVSANGRILDQYPDLAASPANTSAYWVTVINHTSGAKIEVTDAAANVGDPRPQTLVGTLLAGGNDGGLAQDADYIGDASAKTGLYAFDRIQKVNLLAIPGITSNAVQKALLDYATTRTDLFAIISTPLGLDTPGVDTYVTQTLNAVTSYGAVYTPWVKAVSPLSGQAEVVPPDGFIMGMYARTDQKRNVAKAPAGIVDGQLLGVLGVERDISRAEYDLLYPDNINAILSLPGSGVCAFGSRTLETGPFRQISTRRLFTYVELSLAAASKFALFEPNTPETRQAIVRQYTGFLRGLRQGKMLLGASDKDAFYVVSDGSNNPPSQVLAGQLRARVGLAILSPSEFFTLEVEQNTQALDASLAS